MTKKELLEMAAKLQAQAESMPDDTTESASTTGSEESTAKKPVKDDNNEVNGDPKPAEPNPASEDNEPEPELNANGEIEEQPQIEPQTNGKITDDIKPGVDTAFEQSTTATETAGVEQVLEANLDQRFATMLKQYTDVKTELDKMKVVLSEILSRISLVEEVTDKVTTVDHDSLLTESIKLLV